MFKYFRYIFLILILFILFDSNVYAKKKYSSGDCIYNLQGSSFGSTGNLSLKIHQTSKGKITYYYSYEKITVAKDSRWQKEGKGLTGLHIKNSGKYNSCPKFAHIKNVSSGHNVLFSNNEKENGYDLDGGIVLDKIVGPEGDDLPTTQTLDETNLIGEKTTINTCEDLITGDLAKMLKSLVSFVRIIVPIILTGFGTADFSRAVFAGNEDDMKKAQSKFIKRLIIGVVIFLIPSFLRIILGIAHRVWPIVDASLCGIV